MCANNAPVKSKHVVEKSVHLSKRRSGCVKTIHERAHLQRITGPGLGKIPVRRTP